MVNSYMIYRGKSTHGYFMTLLGAQCYALPGDYIVTVRGKKLGQGKRVKIRKVTNKLGPSFRLACKFVNKLGE